MDLCGFEASLVYTVSSRQLELHSETLQEREKEGARCQNQIKLGLTCLLTGLISEFKKPPMLAKSLRNQSTLFA